MNFCDHVFCHQGAKEDKWVTVPPKETVRRIVEGQVPTCI